MLPRRLPSRTLLRRLAIVAVLAAAWPTVVGAQCDINVPGSARGYALEFVRAFVPCAYVTPGPSSAWPNVETSAGLPACQNPGEPTPSSPFGFADRGRCRLSLRQVAESPCKQGDQASDCTALRVSARCGGVLTPNGDPVSSVNWKLSLRYRITIDDDSDGPMTIVDLPVTLTFPAPQAGEFGELMLSGRVPTCDLATTSECLLQLPPCASIELQAAQILDPSGEVFAAVGSASR